jgi:AraC family transcriptional regulator of arabinose operon
MDQKAVEEVLACSYAYHMQPFYTNFISKLPSYLLRLQTEGVCQAFVDGKMVEIAEGDLLLYLPDDPYMLNIDSINQKPVSSGDYYIFCQGDWIANWWNRNPRKTRTKINLDEHILSLWKQTILEKRRLSEENYELIGHLLRALCLSIDRSINETFTLPTKSYTATRMKRYIEEHATQTFKVEDVAEHVSLSVSRAIHLFKETFEITMIQYSLEVRLSLAVDRMRYSDLNLGQIAMSCGFGSYPYFHRAFKDRYGESPKRYRKKE